MPPKLFTVSFGCQMSAADAEEMAAPFSRRGWARAAGLDDAQAVLINTCTVRQHAEDRALSLIGRLREWKSKDPRRILIIAGCAAERLGEGLKRRFPYVDLVAGARSIEDFPELAESSLGDLLEAWEEDRAAFPETGAALPSASPVVSFVTIMRGCNYSCAYCVVPSVRGREIYRPPGAVLEEAGRRVREGAREILLLGQTVNSYRYDEGGKTVDFAELLRRVDRTPGLERLRFMSPHPRHFGTRVMSALSECRTVCEHIHLPIQSGSDRILGLMRRSYDTATLLGRVARLRAAVPGLVVSTDIIIGFPTETDEDFGRTLSLLETLRPVSAYCFKYSPRPGTDAGTRPDDVPRDVKEARLRIVNELVANLTRQALEDHRGKTVRVLAEDAFFGRTRTNFGVRLSGAAAPGGLVDAVITDVEGSTLLGRLLK